MVYGKGKPPSLKINRNQSLLEYHSEQLSSLVTMQIVAQPGLKIQCCDERKHGLETRRGGRYPSNRFLPENAKYETVERRPNFAKKKLRFFYAAENDVTHSLIAA